VSFEVEAGTIFGLLGPNGAGKSTTVKILSTLSRADSGTAQVAGIDVARHPEQVRRAIGFVAQKAVADPMDTGRENLALAGRLQGMSGSDARARAAELLARFSLADAADRLVKTYSGGMARKLDVAIGLMNRPQVLFLDEPTTGLDPEARAEMWSELEAMAKVERMTVLLTTHYLEEADRLANRLAIVDHGRIVVTGAPEQLKDGLHGDAVIVELATAGDAAQGLQLLQRLPGLDEVLVDGRVLRSRAASGAGALPHVLAALDDAKLAVSSATVARPSLDDVYLRHTGHSYSTAVSEAAASEGVSA
jgi:ABC-2 type transport system ATP-binding protein